MRSAVKAVLRPLYRALVELPGIRQAIAREAARRAPPERDIFAEFVRSGPGSAYGVTEADRQRLVDSFRRNCRAIEAGTAPEVHAALAAEILAIPPDVEGDVIECGVFKGVSSASLSLVCRMVGRRLLVCDSFEGLPDEGERVHVAAHFGHYGYYRKGMFCGRLEEVRANIAQYGDIGVCEFIRGFFSESLPALSSPLAFAFLDVDLVDSTKDCLRYVWPLLVDGGAIYSDDATDLDVVAVFFDKRWWNDVFREAAPGFVGSGCGLPLTRSGSSLGYIRKSGEFDPGRWKKVPWLHYPTEQPDAT